METSGATGPTIQQTDMQPEGQLGFSVAHLAAWAGSPPRRNSACHLTLLTAATISRTTLFWSQMEESTETFAWNQTSNLDPHCRTYLPGLLRPILSFPAKNSSLKSKHF